MHNIYEEQVGNFFNDVISYMNKINFNFVKGHIVDGRDDAYNGSNHAVELMYMNWEKLMRNPDSKLDTLRLNPEWFSLKDKDYRAYYACLNAYNAVVQYYRYCAKYNMKDAELELAIKNWYAVTKPNMLSIVFGAWKKRQK